jgi:hypothetical protein
MPEKSISPEGAEVRSIETKLFTTWFAVGLIIGSAVGLLLAYGGGYMKGFDEGFNKGYKYALSIPPCPPPECKLDNTLGYLRCIYKKGEKKNQLCP